MLNKELCQECTNEWFTEMGIVLVGDDGEFGVWGISEERHWNDGYVFCHHIKGTVLIRRKAVRSCLYRLEQILADQAL